jgi:type I restriction enzyme S subunit
MKRKKFSSIIEINPSVKLQVNGEYSFIEMKDLDENQRYVYPSTERPLAGGARFEEEDTLFARITPCLENGKICQARGLKGGRGFGSTEFLVFRARPGISDPAFVYYLSRCEEVRRYAELNMVGTSGRQRVPKDVFDKLEIDVPDLPTQTRIAFILSALDYKIELNRRTNHTLEQMAQTLFKKYFVDDIDPDNLPEGWRWGKLGELMNFRNGKSSPPRSISGCYPVYGSNGVIGNCDIFNSNECSIVIGRVGSYCGSVYYTLGKAFITDNAIIGEPANANSSSFCFLLLLSLELNNYRGGSGQPLINQSVLSNIKTIIPNRQIIEEFESKVFPLYEMINSNSKESISNSNIRDILLPKLMSGEIKL